jgi:hypothetical protein
VGERMLVDSPVFASHDDPVQLLEGDVEDNQIARSPVSRYWYLLSSLDLPIESMQICPAVDDLKTRIIHAFKHSAFTV